MLAAVYLSPIVDCFDGLVVSWTLGTRPDAELVNTMLDTAIETVTFSESNQSKNLAASPMVSFRLASTEMAAWQRVGAHQQWIDQAMRAHYPDAPKSRAEVKGAVTEGDAGAKYVYFLLEFNGVRADPQQWLSVDYETRDGTAKADEDYLAVNGTLVLYPGENQAVIPVEVLGDQVAETDEVFSLAVYNPVGGTFGFGRTELVANRVILNDDLWT